MPTYEATIGNFEGCPQWLLDRLLPLLTVCDRLYLENLKADGDPSSYSCLGITTSDLDAFVNLSLGPMEIYS
ncbi:hypothetical protein Ccrd_025953 [Cynara cardunculus var. scolymus]|uniref:Uncharacterized protein n=1 Tax=Cynara cardunculus var. scolymus TaxID=59895 RepID=A0A103T8X4_CYNCS|nr:hypothetical protein Ccrd_025953 [Cynara cardunculus var. scolymus]